MATNTPTTTIYPAGQPPSLPHIGAITTMKAKSASPPLSPDGSEQPDDSKKNYRRLSQAEWAQFCRAIGAFRDDESQELVRPKSLTWPPKGLQKNGLYRDVLFEKAKFTWWFHVVLVVHWILMLVQLALSAVLTALGAISNPGKAVTIIAAINTCIAGILALMHNSGLPDRYRSDRNEFYKVELHMKEIIDGRLVPTGQGIDDVIARCFDCFREAKQVVQNNMPASYAPGAPINPNNQPNNQPNNEPKSGPKK
ncbi:hypothetical protein F4778DRAFT_619900 [Xylariomycetidae sp. FL2044]|nr:hypothetical protein F4778DRAFT_619900 [Xylariomycetidae sp. FL2044]